MSDAVSEAAIERCPAWGHFVGDAETNNLRRHGVKVAGPCKLPIDHDGEHSLVAPTDSVSRLRHLSSRDRDQEEHP